MSNYISNVPEASLDSVQFIVPTADFIRSWAAEKITNFGPLNRDVAQHNSLTSPASGAFDRNTICANCLVNPCGCDEAMICYELPWPCYHQLFLHHVETVLNCICIWCGQLRINKHNDQLMQMILNEKNPITRRQIIVKLSKDIVYCSLEKKRRKKEKKQKQVPVTDTSINSTRKKSAKQIAKEKAKHEQQLAQMHVPTVEENNSLLNLERLRQVKTSRCGCVQFTVKVKNIFEIHCQPKEGTADFPLVKNKVYTKSVSKVLSLLRGMSDEDVTLLGYSPAFAHPSSVIMQVMMVPGASFRIVYGPDKSRSSNPFTKKADDIIKFSEALREWRINYIKQKRRMNDHEGTINNLNINMDNNNTILLEDEEEEEGHNQHQPQQQTDHQPAKKKMKKQQYEDSKVTLNMVHNKRLDITKNSSAYRSRDHTIDDTEWEDYSTDDLYDMYQEFRDMHANVQYLISSYFKSDLPPPKHNLKHLIRIPITNIQSISLKCNGKYGMFRGQGLSKRCDSVCRGVISSSGQDDIDHLLTPLPACMTVTTREIVDQFNIQRLRRLLLNGPSQYPGSNKVRIDPSTLVLEPGDEHDEFFVQILRQKTPQEIDLKHMDTYLFADQYLRVGMIVRRHLVNGDSVMFNRQPSLHKASYQGFKLIASGSSAYGLNPATCVAFNADYDGDAMLMHVGQTVGSINESKNLLSVSKNILNSQSNMPIISPIQDTILGLALMTNPKVIMTNYDYLRYMSEARYNSIDDLGQHTLPYATFFSSTKEIASYRTGKQLFSQTLPKGFNFSGNSTDRRMFHASPCVEIPPSSSSSDDKTSLKEYVWEWHQACMLNPSKQPVMIKNRCMVSGIITAKHIGKSSTAIIHQLVHEYGAERCRRYQSDLQRVVSTWLSEYGFTLTIQDFLLPDPGPVQEMIDLGLKGIREHPLLQSSMELIKPQFSPIYHTHPDKATTTSILQNDHHTNPEYVRMQYRYISTVETRLVSLLNQYTVLVNRAVQEQIQQRNNVYHMVAAGTKGNDANAPQMMAMIGQVMCHGRRVKNDQRIPMHFFRQSDRHRILELVQKHPELADMFEYYLDTLMARGFVSHGYASTGLNAHEFFYHSMLGRLGVAASHLSTEQVGYFQRRMIKAMENIRTYFDYSVRDMSGNILHLLYGRDGFSRERMCRLHFPFVLITDQQIDARYSYVQNHLSRMPAVAEEEDDGISSYDYYVPTPDDYELEKTELLRLKKLRHKLCRFQTFRKRYNVDEMILVPVDVEKVLTLARQKQLHLNDSNSHQRLEPQEVMKYVVSCMERMYRFYPGFFNRLWDFEAHYYTSLSVKQVLFAHQLNKFGLQWALAEIEVRFYEAFVNPNEAVGVNSGQVVGHTQTQNSLDAHKISDSNEKDRSSLSDIMMNEDTNERINIVEMYTDVSKNPKIMIVYVYPISLDLLNEYYNHDHARIKEELDVDLTNPTENHEWSLSQYICKTLVQYHLSDLCLEMPTVLREESLEQTHVQEDRKWIKRCMKNMFPTTVEEKTPTIPEEDNKTEEQEEVEEQKHHDDEEEGETKKKNKKPKKPKKKPTILEQPRQSLRELFVTRHVPCVMRFVINVDMLDDLYLHMEDLIEKLRRFFREEDVSGTQSVDSDLTSIWMSKKSKELTFLYSPIIYSPVGKRYRVLRIYVCPQSIKYKQIAKAKQISYDPYKCVQSMLNTCYHKALISGVKGVTHTNIGTESYQHFDEQTKLLTTKKRTVIIASTTRVLAKSMSINHIPGILSHPLVDERHCHSSCMWRSNNVWGIHHCRQVMRSFLQRNMDDYVDATHSEMLIATVVHRGYLMPFRRQGISNVKDAGALQRSSFEQPLATCVEAATTAEIDYIKGPTESTITGRLMNLGTGSVDGQVKIVEDDKTITSTLNNNNNSIPALPLYTELDRRVLIYNTGEENKRKSNVYNDLFRKCQSVSTSTLFHSFDQIRQTLGDMTNKTKTSNILRMSNQRLVEQMQEKREHAYLRHRAKIIMTQNLEDHNPARQQHQQPTNKKKEKEEESKTIPIRLLPISSIKHLPSTEYNEWFIENVLEMEEETPKKPKKMYFQQDWTWTHFTLDNDLPSFFAEPKTKSQEKKHRALTNLKFEFGQIMYH